MKRIKNYLRSKPHVAVSVPAAICSYDFIADIIGIVRNIEGDLSTISTIGGVEALVLVGLMFLLRKGSCEMCGEKRSKSHKKILAK